MNQVPRRVNIDLSSLPRKFLQIHITQLQLFETGINSLWDILDVRYDCGGHEQFLSRDFAFLDRDADFPFRVINFSCVKMIVSKLQCGLNGVDQSPIGTAIIGALVPSSAS